jgi:hypothetical protein
MDKTQKPISLNQTNCVSIDKRLWATLKLSVMNWLAIYLYLLPKLVDLYFQALIRFLVIVMHN